MKATITFIALFGLIRLSPVGFFLERTPQGTDSKTYIHIYFKQPVSTVETKTDLDPEEILIFELPKSIASNGTEIPFDTQRFQIRICHKIELTSQFKCFLPVTHTELYINDYMDRYSHQVNLGEEKYCSFGNMTQQSQYVFEKAINKKDPKLYLNSIKDMSLKEDLKPFFEDPSPVFSQMMLGAVDRILGYENFYRRNLCQSVYQLDLRPEVFQPQLVFNKKQGELATLSLFIQEPAKDFNGGFEKEMTNEEIAEVDLSEKLDEQENKVNVQINKNYHEILVNLEEDKILKVFPKNSVPITDKEDSEKVKKFEENEKLNHEKFLKINTYSIKEICQNEQIIRDSKQKHTEKFYELIVMYCSSEFTKANKKFEIEYLNLEECKPLESIKNKIKRPLCNINQSQTFPWKYQVEIPDYQMVNTDSPISIVVKRDSLKHTCDFINDKLQNLIYVRCFGKFEIKTKVKDIQLNEEFKENQNKFIRDKSEQRRRLLKVELDGWKMFSLIVFIVALCLLVAFFSAIPIGWIVVIIIILCALFYYIFIHKRVLFLKEYLAKKNLEVFNNLSQTQSDIIIEEIQTFQSSVGKFMDEYENTVNNPFTKKPVGRMVQIKVNDFLEQIGLLKDRHIAAFNIDKKTGLDLEQERENIKQQKLIMENKETLIALENQETKKNEQKIDEQKHKIVL